MNAETNIVSELVPETAAAAPINDDADVAEIRKILSRLAKGESKFATLSPDTKRQRDDWIAYGNMLRPHRDKLSKKQFGQWVKANGLDESPASHQTVRSAAMWLAEYMGHNQDTSWLERISSNLHNPKHIRAAYNKLMKAEAAPADDTKPKAKRASFSSPTTYLLDGFRHWGKAMMFSALDELQDGKLDGDIDSANKEYETINPLT